MNEVVHAEILQQWRLKAPLSAVDCGVDLIVAGVQYADCNVLRVYKPNKSDTSLLVAPEQDEVLVKGEQQVELHGHLDRISCIRLFCSHSETTLIASSSSDCILVWSWPSATTSCRDIRELTSHLVRKKPLVECNCMAFDTTGTVLALATEKQVELVQILSGETIVILQGHLAKVTKCMFHPLHPHVIVTGSEDRTFKLWDLQDKTILFQSAVLSAFVVVALAVNEVTGDLAVGFADGSLRFFAIDESNRFFARELVTLNVAKFIDKTVRGRLSKEQEDALAHGSPKVISSLPSWARKDKQVVEDSSDVVVATAETACSILSLQYLCCVPLKPTASLPSSSTGFCARQFNSHQDQRVTDTHQFLLVGLPNHLVVVNAFSYELSVLVDFQHPQQQQQHDQRPHDRVQIARDFSFCVDPSLRLLTCGVMSAFQPLLTQFAIGLVAASSSRSCDLTPMKTSERSSHRAIACSASNHNNNESNYDQLSILPQHPPPQDSILLAPSKLQRSPDSSSGNTTKTNRLVDKPVTFHSRIKSSGYGSTLPFSLQQKKKRQTIQQRKTPVAAKDSPRFMKEYPVDCGLFDQFQAKHALPPQTLHHGAIHWIEYSSDAKWLALAGNDQVAQTCRLPFAKFKGGNANVLAGHNGAVKSIRFAHSNKLVVTTSVDQTARLWSVDTSSASAVANNNNNISDVYRNVRCCLTLSTVSRHKPKAQELVDARFFYMDKFLLVTSGTKMRLYEYDQQRACASTNLNVSATKGSCGSSSSNRGGGGGGGTASTLPTISRQAEIRKSKVFTYECDGMQQITCVTSVNALLSQVLVAGGSDRSIRILDACYGKEMRQITESHAKAPHSLVLPTPSCFVSHPGNFYDLLLSSASNSSIHLWDIRADNCVLRLSEHVNRAHALGVAFSPCMRYIATGSEDRCGYLYDLRTGRCLRKLGGHRDVVTCVAFNPFCPQLATASYDSTVRFYSDH